MIWRWRQGESIRGLVEAVGWLRVLCISYVRALVLQEVRACEEGRKPRAEEEEGEGEAGEDAGEEDIAGAEGDHCDDRGEVSLCGHEESAVILLSRGQGMVVIAGH